MKVTTGKVLAYTLLPQTMPRFRRLFAGFGFVSFFLAQVYRSTGLLPAGHPYLLPGNIGRYGISHVIAEAGLILKRKGAGRDQVVIYWLLMLALVILMAQFALLIGSAFVQIAHAADASSDGISASMNFFTTTNPGNDLAFMMLDRVFGIPKLFNSCVAGGSICLGEQSSTGTLTTEAAGPSGTAFPTAFHMALHSIFQLYSVALLCIAAMILCYFVFAVVAETAESGTPFGRRFNKVWAPLRLVLALGLLIPIANGLNAAQYLALYAAKFGSGFATNGWSTFVSTAVSQDTTLLGDSTTLIAIANAPPVNTLMSFFALVSTCKQAYEVVTAGDTSAAGASDAGNGNSGGGPVKIQAYLINAQTTPAYKLVDDSSTFDDALKYSNNGNIIMRFGEYRTDAKGKPVYTDDTSNVAPLCGEITFPVTNTDQATAPGALDAMQSYYKLVTKSFWADVQNSGTVFYKSGHAQVQHSIPMENANKDEPLPTQADMVNSRKGYAESIANILESAADAQRSSTLIKDTAKDLTQYGWAGAGIWYNKIAQINGSLIAAVYNLPVVTKMPKIMEDVQKSNLSHSQDTPGPDRYTPYQAGSQGFEGAREHDKEIAVALAKTYKNWSESFSEINVSGNIIIDGINAVFGSAGLFSMSSNQTKKINPLAQLVSMGRGILESSVRNLGFASFAGLGGGLVNFQNNYMAGTAALAASSMLWTVATMTLMIGFLLYYVLPFLPFIYFFFAVGGWVKAIFEAMVGVPLWALAHLRIDGNGLPGDAAMGGYFLLLEIFLRPILIIFGMLGGITLFVAQATVLNEIWSLVTSNLTGFNRSAAADVTTSNATGGLRYLRDAFDQLFFSVVYAIVVYMLGMSSFKMVDQVPEYALRWMGASVQAFGEGATGDHPGDHLMGQGFAGAQQMMGRLQERGVTPGRMGGSMAEAGQGFSRVMSRNSKP